MRPLYSLLHKTTLNCTFAALVVVTQGNSVNAEESGFSFSGTLNAYGRVSENEATDLVPNPASSGFLSQEGGFTGVLQAETTIGSLNFSGQARLEIESESSATGFLDELFVEMPIGSNGFAFAGRRILSFGHAYGLNPSDVFRDPLAENSVYGSDQARNNTLGEDMVGADILFDSGATLTALYSFQVEDPGSQSIEDFPMLRYSWVGSGDTVSDYALSAFGGARPGVGFSASFGVGDATVLYVDANLRQGRDRVTLGGIDGLGQLTLNPRNTSDLHQHITLGLGHTFGSGLSLNVELSHDANGYSDTEWQQIASALDQVSPATSAIHGQSIGQLNGMLNHYTLRRNYAFARVAHDSVFGSDISGELTLLHGLDDGSGTFAVRLEKEIFDQVTLGVVGTQRYGSTNSEFTLRPGKNSLSVYTSIKF